MKSSHLPLAALLLTSMPSLATSLTYPAARRADTVEQLHGVAVADPYRWMEDIDSAETVAWVDAQAGLAQGFLGKLPQRARLWERLKQLQDYDKHGLPQRVAGRLFYARKTGLQGQAITYWREDAPGSVEHVLLDPNGLSKDGTVALTGYDITEDGKWMAYGLSEAGSDWERWKVREVESGKDLADDLRWVKFSGASWSVKGDGFYYSRYAAPEPGQELKEQNLNQKL